MAAFPAHRREQGSGSPAPSAAGAALRQPAGRQPAGRQPAGRQPARPRPAQTDRPATNGQDQPQRLRVAVTHLAADGNSLTRSTLDSDAMPPADGHRLHDLVDAVEAAGPPAGSSFGLVQRQGAAAPSYEVTAARGFGHWTVTVPVWLRGTALAALIDHVCGAPDGS